MAFFRFFKRNKLKLALFLVFLLAPLYMILYISYADRQIASELDEASFSCQYTLNKLIGRFSADDFAPDSKKIFRASFGLRDKQYDSQNFNCYHFVDIISHIPYDKRQNTFFIVSKNTRMRISADAIYHYGSEAQIQEQIANLNDGAQVGTIASSRYDTGRDHWGVKISMCDKAPAIMDFYGKIQVLSLEEFLRNVTGDAKVWVIKEKKK